MSAYRTPGMTSKESIALQLASDVLSTGSNSRMYKKMVDDKKNSLRLVLSTMHWKIMALILIMHCQVVLIRLILC
jgi:hypothetical protein